MGKVLDKPDGKWTYLSRSHRSLRGLVQFFHGLGVVAEIRFAANEDDRQAGAEMKDLGDPLCQPSQRLLIGHVTIKCISYLLLDVVKGIGRVDSEADENDMGIRVRQRAQTVVIFLSSRIPQR